jgi:hypothetical protein
MTQINTINITANSTGFSNTTETIKISNASSTFSIGDRFYYYVPSANTPIAPLVGNTYYYVSFVNTSVIALSASAGGANINITDARVTNPGETHKIQVYTPQLVNVGQANNDHNGDTLRRAMQKINQNFSDIYVSLQPNATNQSVLIPNTLTLGNASVYATVNSSYYTGTAYNALQLGGVNANAYIQNTDSRTLSGNLAFTGSNVTFSTINVGGNTLIANSSGIYTTGTINAASINVSGLANVANLNVSGQANISGNLYVAGTLLVSGNTTYINATIIETKDKNLWLANNAATAVAADGAGILIGTYANLVYNSSNDAFQSNAGFIPSVNNLALGTNTNLWNLTANSITAFNIYANTKLQIGNSAGYNFGANAVIEIDQSANTFIQVVIQNANAGINASGDLVITADTGNNSVNYVDFGINSSNYSNATYGITGALDAYLYSSNSNLAIGTASDKDIIFHANGTLATNRVLTVNSTAVTVANLQTFTANVMNITTVNAVSVNATGNVVATNIIASYVNAAASVNTTNLNVTTKIQVGNSAGYNFGSLAVIEIDASANTYQQIVIQNANTGTQASGDLVITADTGNDSVNYVDFGINGSNYSNTTYGITGALDAYLYSSNSQLVMGTASVKDIVFHAGGTLATNRVLTVNTTAVTVANGQTLAANNITSNGIMVPNVLTMLAYQFAF